MINVNLFVALFGFEWGVGNSIYSYAHTRVHAIAKRQLSMKANRCNIMGTCVGGPIKGCLLHIYFIDTLLDVPTHYPVVRLTKSLIWDEDKPTPLPFTIGHYQLSLVLLATKLMVSRMWTLPTLCQF